MSEKDKNVTDVIRSSEENPFPNIKRKYYPLREDEFALEAQLMELVKSGQLTAGEALEAFDIEMEKKAKELSKLSPEEFNKLAPVTQRPTDKQIIQQQAEEFSANQIKAIQEREAKLPFWERSILPIPEQKISGADEKILQQLAQQNNLAAQHELAERKRVRGMSFLEQLNDERGRDRLLRTALKSPADLYYGVTEGIPALYTKGVSSAIEALTGEEISLISNEAKERLQKFDQTRQENNQAYGVNDPINSHESLASSVVGAVVPGGLAAKAIGVGVDFGVDQTVRELSDAKGEKYETVFDKLGITSNQENPLLGPMAAIGVGMFAGTLTASAISKLSTTRLKPVTARLITDIDPDAPKNLYTIEKASDLTKTNVVDEQRALNDIIERHGVVNAKDLEARIEFETHSAAQTRVKEALATGKLKAFDAEFEVPVPPQALYKAYNSLSPKMRTDVKDFVLLRDVLDDAKILASKGQETGPLQLEIKSMLAHIEKRTPLAKAMADDYNSITKGLRNFAEGSLFSPEYRKHLDQTRANYVPMEFSNVDPSAPVMQRLSQAQSEGGSFNQEWFLQNRNVDLAKISKMERHIDPFEMLMQSTEATLIARMKNDSKVAIIDGLLNSETAKSGTRTIRKATSEEAAKHPNRVVSIYRNGEKEQYLTSQLTANLIRFDPYIAKWPAMFVPKRIFEQTTVGPLSLTFAPITALRDTIGGMVTRTPGTIAPNFIDTAKAVPEQLWAKSLKTLSSSLETAMAKNLDPEMQQTLQPLARQIAEEYNNTLYHTINSYGGFDTSLMKERITVGNGMLKEAARTIDNAVDTVNIPGVKFSARRIKNMAQGFTSIFNAIQEAPRFAAIKKTVESGVDIQTATKKARELTGDVSKSGRVFDASGKQIKADAVDQGVLNLSNKGIGLITEGLRESTPFLNPMIQGNRRLLNSIIDDPVGFNLRVWSTVGIPSLVFFGWNEMLGKEYNDYAMQRRSGRDVAMNLYLGIPGLEPEKGIEIPLPHELLAYSSPFTRGLYGMSRGENEERTRAALSVLAGNILDNSLDVSTPVIMNAGLNLAGISSSESLIRPSKGVYKIRDDEVGILADNMDHLARTLFSSIGETVIYTANALDGERDFVQLGKDLQNRTLSRMPIAKNVLGKKKANIHFSVPKEVVNKQFKSVRRFKKYYDAHLNEKRFTEDGMQKPSSKNYYTSLAKAGKRHMDLGDLPYAMLGPEKLKDIQNPVYKEFGQMIMDKAFRGNEGMTGLVDRERTYSKYIKRLKQFHSGDGKALKKWQSELNGLSPATEETEELRGFLSDHDLSLESYDDRIKLINIIEKHRADIIHGQRGVFENIEEEITQILRSRGILKKEQRFDITKHLDPLDPSPFQK